MTKILRRIALLLHRLNTLQIYNYLYVTQLPDNDFKVQDNLET
jgi:hypothetical protein